MKAAKKKMRGGGMMKKTKGYRAGGKATKGYSKGGKATKGYRRGGAAKK